MKKMIAAIIALALLLLIAGNGVVMQVGASSSSSESDLPATDPSVSGQSDGEVLNIVSEGTCGDNLTWTLDDAGTLTISGTGEMADYNGDDNCAPWIREDVQSIVVQNGVTAIGNYAFYHCEFVSSLEIPASVTSIGDSAFFYMAGIETFTISAQVTHIGSAAFGSCDGLQSISVEEGNANYCSVDGVLFDKSMESLIQYPLGRDGSYQIPDGVTSIGIRAFCRSGVSEIVFPDSLTSIGELAFASCSGLREVALPDSVTTIGRAAFHQSTNIKEIRLPKSLIYIEDEVFFNCFKLESIEIPETVTSIGVYAFYSCNSLTDVTVPRSVTEIYDGAFYHCNSLKTIFIPDSVNHVYNNAIGYCASLEHIFFAGTKEQWNTNFQEQTIYPGTAIHYEVKSVAEHCIPGTTVGSTCTEQGYTQYSCSCGHSWNEDKQEPLGHRFANGECTVCGQSKLPAGGTFGDNITWSLDVAGTMTISGSGYMDLYELVYDEDNDWYEEVSVPAPWADYIEDIKSLIVENGITNVDGFEDCINLTSISLPESIKGIKSFAFDSCESLQEVIIPENVIYIGQRAFGFCTNLRTVSIPASVESIGWMAFGYCESLHEFEIPAGVTDMEDRVFSGCSALEKITVHPDNTAFCSVDGILYRKDLTELIFCPEAKNGNVTVPDGVERIVSYAFYRCKNINEVILPDSLTYIGDYAFNSTGIQNVFIPEAVLSVGHSIFNRCDKLISIKVHEENLNYSSVDGILYNKGKTELIKCPEGKTGVARLPDSVITINAYAFQTSQLMEVVLPAKVVNIGAYSFDGCEQLKRIDVAPENEHYSSIDGILYNKEQTKVLLCPLGRTAPVMLSDTVISVEATGIDTDSGTVFDWSALEGINVEPGNPYFSSIDGILYNKDQTEILQCPGGRTAPVLLPDTVVSIGSYACNTKAVIDELVIPANVQIIQRHGINYASFEKIIFLGDAPAIESDVPDWVNATIYYPADNATWTEEVRQSFGGENVTWIAAYKVLEGEESPWNPADSAEISVRVDSEPEAFRSVSVDGVEVAPSNYTVTRGSTIVTFHEDYLKTLSSGEHDVTIAFEDGVATAVIVISRLIGDITGDGKVNNRDAVRLMQQLAGWDVEFVQAALDINGDGKVNNRDAIRLMQYLAGWEVEIN